MPSILTLEKALLVEGQDEEYFFNHLFSHLGIKDVQVRQVYGKDRFKEGLEAFVLDPGYERVTAFAIIRDADNNAQATFQSAFDTLGNLGLPQPKRAGEFANKNRKKVGVFIVPADANTGMLENLCLKTVGSHPIMPHVETFFSTLDTVLTKRIPPDAPMQNGVNYYPKNEAKAKVQAFLSGMHESVNGIGRAAKEGYWNFDHESLAELKKFIANLRTPV